MQVQTLISPTADDFRKAIDSLQPNIVYLQGERLVNDQVGSLLWEAAQDLPALFASTLPTTVCLYHHKLLYVMYLFLIFSLFSSALALYAYVYPLK